MHRLYCPAWILFRKAAGHFIYCYLTELQQILINFDFILSISSEQDSSFTWVSSDLIGVDKRSWKTKALAVARSYGRKYTWHTWYQEKNYRELIAKYRIAGFFRVRLC